VRAPTRATRTCSAIDRNYTLETGKLQQRIAQEQAGPDAGGAGGGGTNWKAMLAVMGRRLPSTACPPLAWPGSAGRWPAVMMMGYMGAARRGDAGVMLVANAYRDAQENAKKLVESSSRTARPFVTRTRRWRTGATDGRGQRSQQAFDILQAEIDKQRDIAHAADKEIKSTAAGSIRSRASPDARGTTQLDIRLEAMKKQPTSRPSRSSGQGN